MNALPAPSASGAPAVSTSAAPPASAALAASSAPAPEPASAGAAPPARASGVTAQRKAADAVAEGDYAAAVERYRSLAREEPGVQAYPEAARILEERANAARR